LSNEFNYINNLNLPYKALINSGYSENITYQSSVSMDSKKKIKKKRRRKMIYLNNISLTERKRR